MTKQLLPALNLSSMQISFDDEFNSFTASANGSNGWMTQMPFYHAERTLSWNNEAQYYSDSSVGVNPFSLSNGVLNITAAKAAAGSTPGNLPYTSGIITSYKSFAQLYGYFEVRAQLPAGQGLWPAFWLMPVNGAPKVELDIFEILGNSPTTLHATTHTTTTAGLSQALQVANTSTGFHTYGVDWEPTTVTFYMDGQAIATAVTPTDMNVPMYMLLNLAVGGAGSWPGATNASTPFPATMKIDDVRVYATAGTVGTSDAMPSVAVTLPTIQATAAAGNGSISANVLHVGPSDGGSPQAGVGVALLNAQGQVVATTVTDVAGKFTFANLAAATYRIRYIAPPSLMLQQGSQADTTTGLTASINLPNFAITLIHQNVTSSAHLDGSVVLAGVPQAGVAVTLRDAARNAVATTATDANGRFEFYAAPGTYTVVYTPPSGDALASGSHADTATGASPPVALIAGQSFALQPEQLIALNNSSLGGQVVDGNGAGLAGAAVTLLSGGSTVATTTSGSDGAFRFGGLAAGTYTVRYAPLSNTLLASGSAADPATGLSAPVAVAAGQAATLAAETLVPVPATVSGSVVYSRTGLTPQSAQAGVAVSLIRADGSLAALTATDAGGRFSFASVAPASYQVRYTAASGTVLQLGGPADAASGLTTPMTLAAGQAVTLGAEQLLSVPGSIGAVVLHYGQGDAGTALSGVGVTLLDATGRAVASQVTGRDGSYRFTNLAAGSYQVRYTPQSWGVLAPGPADVATGLTGTIALQAGFQLTLTHERVTSLSNDFTMTGAGALALRGAGNYTVTGDASGGTLTLGGGNQTVTLTGAGNTVTLGAGSSTVSLGAGSTIHAAGGAASTTTIAAHGGGNLIDVLAGASFVTTEGGAGDVIMTNAKGQGLTTLGGFNLASSDVIDLKRTLAGLSVQADLGNVGNFVTAANSGGNTTLYVDPTGGRAAPAAFAVLSNTTTSVADLLAGHHLSLA